MEKTINAYTRKNKTKYIPYTLKLIIFPSTRIYCFLRSPGRVSVQNMVLYAISVQCTLTRPVNVKKIIVYGWKTKKHERN